MTTLVRLKALADATRLRTLFLLEAEELTVKELTDILGMSQSRVSTHLGVLRESGFVRDRRQGTSAFYSLSREGEASVTWEALRATTQEPSETERDRIRLAEVLARRVEPGREFFDRVAEGWDTGRSESLGTYAGSFALAGLIPRELTLLDVGTGTGSLLPLLARHVDRVLAVDLSRGMLERARDRVRAARANSVTFLRADAGRLPLPDASVDGAVINMVMHHLNDPSALLREVSRVLREDARLVLIDFETHQERWLLDEEGHRWAGFEPAQLGAWCIDAGLSVPEFQRIPTPTSGRWSRLNVFTARSGRAQNGGRVRAR